MSVRDCPISRLHTPRSTILLAALLAETVNPVVGGTVVIIGAVLALNRTKVTLRTSQRWGPAWIWPAGLAVALAISLSTQEPWLRWLPRPAADHVPHASATLVADDTLTGLTVG